MEANFVINVAPEKLKEQAETVTEYVNAIEKDFNEIRQIVKNSALYWQGDASKKHRQIFDENEEDIQEIIKRLKEHPVDLQKMAGVYEQTEQLNETQASNLPNEVF